VTEDAFNALAVKLAGIGGALVSMKFLAGTWPERLVLAMGGALFSFYAAPYASHKLGMPEGLAGFLLGLFGMAIVSKVWEWLRTVPFDPVWQIFLDWLRRILGGSK
jgi:hypothetical protein